MSEDLSSTTLCSSNTPSFISLRQFFEEQLHLDRLQVLVMEEFYQNCYKAHMEKKLERKRKKQTNHHESTSNECVVRSQEMSHSDFQAFMELVQNSTPKQACFPRIERNWNEDEDTKDWNIGEEGWLVIQHWMCTVFKKDYQNYHPNYESSSGLLQRRQMIIPELRCELCEKYIFGNKKNHHDEENTLTQFKNARKNFLKTIANSCGQKLTIEPLTIFEKFIDIFTQHDIVATSKYLLSDHACADVFSKGIIDSTMTYFIITRDLQGPNPNSPHQFVELLKGIENNKTIYSIDLSNLVLVHDSSVKALCHMISNKKSLKRVVISGISLSRENYSNALLKAINSSSSISSLEIYVYEEKNSTFRFLENASHETIETLKLLLKSPKLKNVLLSSDIDLSVDHVELVSLLLRNKHVKSIDINIEAREELSERYGDLQSRMEKEIMSIHEFHYKYFYMHPLSSECKCHMFKHHVKTLCSDWSDDDIKLCIDHQLVSACDISANLSLENHILIRPHLFANVKNLTLSIHLDVDQNIIQSLSEIIMNSSTITTLTLTRFDDEEKSSKKEWSEIVKCWSSLFNNSQLVCHKLEKVILRTVNQQVAEQLIPSLLDLRKFPNLTCLEIDYYNQTLSGQCVQAIANSLIAQEKHSSLKLGLKSLHFSDHCFQSHDHTELILRSLMYHKVLTSLYLPYAVLKSVDILSDFIITNKSVQEIRLDYSHDEYKTLENCVQFENSEQEDEFTSHLIQVFGAMQLNWNLTSIDWYSEYYYNSFSFGTVNHVGERFLVEKIMERNNRQQIINQYMTNTLRTSCTLSDIIISTSN
ncbi:hypothetical protein C9374_001226 [Naegleria lovaniensis]|uniref:Uncharacterized protein n=1 Tax=Naegleria lovaniensis TaxID=51637 RepID=A0AA88GVA8_NAELO|nr:uncharacterized protein C9374_001226 [Naegleria lovaniensis]KAG2387632.1 hypothetical protein C9374_001226 [Naegleria lovaniensis]